MLNNPGFHPLPSTHPSHHTHPTLPTRSTAFPHPLSTSCLSPPALPYPSFSPALQGCSLTYQTKCAKNQFLTASKRQGTTLPPTSAIQNFTHSHPNPHPITSRPHHPHPPHHPPPPAIPSPPVPSRRPSPHVIKQVDGRFPEVFYDTSYFAYLSLLPSSALSCPPTFRV